RSGLFVYLAERVLWTNPLGSTNLSGTNLDRRRRAPVRHAHRGGAHGWAEQSLPRITRILLHPGRFVYLAQPRDGPNHPILSASRKLHFPAKVSLAVPG